jgi:F-box/leucine-rich repeat protein 2/20
MLARCPDGAIAALGGACHELREANLTWCVQLTDKGVTALAAGCPRLELLSLHGLRGVTDASIAALAQRCAASLHTLDVSGCVGIARREREALRQLLPALKTFVVHS